MIKQLFFLIIYMLFCRNKKRKTTGKVESGKKYADNIASAKPSINLKSGCTRLRTKYLF